MDVPEAAGAPLGSVLTLIKDRKNCSGISGVGQEYFGGNKESSVCFFQEKENKLSEVWRIRADGSGGWRV